MLLLTDGLFVFLFNHTLCHVVINCLIVLINAPEPEHPLRTDIAEEYSKDRNKFMKSAEEFTKKFAEKRPTD